MRQYVFTIHDAQRACAYDDQARLDILKIHSRKMNLTRGINLKKIADGLTNASGAEIKAVCTGTKPRGKIGMR